MKRCIVNYAILLALSLFATLNSEIHEKTAKPSNAASAIEMGEEELLKQLDPQMRKIYDNLTPEGKAFALKLVNQANPAPQDKNSAVKAAAERDKCESNLNESP